MKQLLDGFAAEPGRSSAERQLGDNQTMRRQIEFTGAVTDNKFNSVAETLHHSATLAAREDDPVNASVLITSSFEEDHISLKHILGQSNWKTHGVFSCRDALPHLRKSVTPIIICEHDLRDGTWSDLICDMAIWTPPPLLIVASRLADERLWTEVVSLGAYDLLAKPFERKEVFWAVSSALRHWTRQLEDSNWLRQAVSP